MAGVDLASLQTKPMSAAKVRSVLGEPYWQGAVSGYPAIVYIDAHYRAHYTAAAASSASYEAGCGMAVAYIENGMRQSLQVTALQVEELREIVAMPLEKTRYLKNIEAEVLKVFEGRR